MCALYLPFVQKKTTTQRSTRFVWAIRAVPYDVGYSCLLRVREWIIRSATAIPGTVQNYGLGILMNESNHFSFYTRLVPYRTVPMMMVIS